MNGSLCRARRAELIHGIDCWAATQLPPAHGGAHMHTESLGAVIDRLARYAVLARIALTTDTTELELHHAWKRLAELALGYCDMASELAAGLRRLPDLGDPALTEPG
ncbi:DUF4254 domain-containing protein [Nocardia donostiensis]|uniref:DUF4254 domain-containing protein n=1 Tax=Nocardia donostiensis TaxID=1538463 RepID=UPI001FE958B8|nr:DUF4254 domain-containing protein [Nocardia donostiensis]